MKKIYSILVAYNPQENELTLAVERLKAQTNMVVVCNNSEYDVKFDDEKIKVFNFRDNLGIARAQSIGMKWAFDNGANFVLQIDQDSIPEERMVCKLLECYNELTERGLVVGLVGPQDYDKDSGEISKPKFDRGVLLKDNCVSVSSALSSGSLISSEAYWAVGGMLDELFIDAVDFEYCWRLRAKGFLVIKNKKALLAHKLGYGRKKLFGLISLGISSPVRNYYQVRNVLLLLNKKYVPIFWKISQLIKVIFKILFYPIIMPNGKERRKYLFCGLVDGLKGRRGPFR